MSSLHLYFNQEYVGELIKQPTGAHVLQYANDWLNNPKSRPLSLSLPLQKGKITSEKVFNYFDNLLPDSRQIREKIVTRFNAKSSQPFDLLAQVGRDSVGALTLLEKPQMPIQKPITARKLDKVELETLLKSYQSDIPLGMGPEFEDFRISVAGAQEKTALLKINKDWYVPSGLTPTTHIFKLPIGEIKSPDATLDLTTSVENEWLCIELARELGFSVPTVEIVTVGSAKALAVERFDRKWNHTKERLIRLPQEDMCQAYGISPAIKYEADGGIGIEQIMALLMGSSNALIDRETFMRFQIFQWLIGATDGHAKNFSIFLEPGGSYKLTPFYDILSAYPLLGGQGLNKRDLSLAMGLSATKGKKRKMELVFSRHFIATAKSTGFDSKRMQLLMDDMAINMQPAIERLRLRIPAEIPEKIQKAIFDKTLERVKRLVM
ncbi:MAG: serine/threonine protein kinase [Alteromonadaceae bacterium]|jgi:serine/threonine-protein kinase HipA|uniref:Type II toxin-antitoxin system HipA family toxin n=1 Tax=Paraglaciecola mesophila TaxID=197222 RepID=A0ABU9SZU5_9ALTE|nr:serine/threonine protein kinase [Alteromonadaceae bacterium]MBB20516.1 serine/threonine protein kinase [Rickettsiales bacterium]|tara:strand:+ start:5702 stop:7009 length:1308 start_codon:yes stop_codon:yes gene_type:complete